MSCINVYHIIHNIGRPAGGRPRPSVAGGRTTRGRPSVAGGRASGGRLQEDEDLRFRITQEAQATPLRGQRVNGIELTRTAHDTVSIRTHGLYITIGNVHDISHPANV